MGTRSPEHSLTSPASQNGPQRGACGPHQGSGVLFWPLWGSRCGGFGLSTKPSAPCNPAGPVLRILALGEWVPGWPGGVEMGALASVPLGTGPNGSGTQGEPVGLTNE